jgi:hypothetical protein
VYGVVSGLSLRLPDTMSSGQVIGLRIFGVVFGRLKRLLAAVEDLEEVAPEP